MNLTKRIEHRIRTAILMGGLVILLQPVQGLAQQKSDASSFTERDGQHDFDFLPGAWKIHNRRLKNPLTGSATWIEFESTSVAKRIWDGRANMDEYEADSPSGHIEGVTVRLYNPKSHQWSLYWANQANGTMETPTIGEFKNGRGDFFDQEFFQGRSIYVRYSWLDITPNSCRWEQAFSGDGGKTWETNWIMEMTRVDR